MRYDFDPTPTTDSPGSWDWDLEVLFVMQRFDRIQVGGARGGIQTEYQADATETKNASTIDVVVTMVDQPAR